MQKTVVVRVESTKEHPKYRRRYRLHKNYKAHVKNGEYQIGDKVIIEECRPISKEKGWKVVKRITAQIGEGSPAEEKVPLKASD